MVVSWISLAVVGLACLVGVHTFGILLIDNKKFG